MYSKLATFFITALFILFSVYGLTFANGGDQRVVEGKYFINLSRSPFTPRVGYKTAMLTSFADVQTNQLIKEDILVNIRIAKLSGEERKREFLYDEKNLKVKGGILEFTYTFTEPGLHEVFFDFSFASNPQKIYNVPDFMLDIQKPEIAEKPNQSIIVWIGLGIILGFGIGWLVTRRRF